MTTARRSHTATLLANGTVLAAAGRSASGPSAAAETYDRATGLWSATGSLAVPRYLHSATSLGTGQVLAAGGISGGPTSATLVRNSSAELYDPATRLWTPTGSLATPRDSHTATVLPGGKVLAAGGNTNPSGAGLSSGVGLSSAELYDPVARAWLPTGSMAAGRSKHTATLLPSGKVLVAGGENGVDKAATATAEIYDPAAGTWSPTGSLATPRDSHTATLLPDGKVLVAGGREGEPARTLASAELYDPATGMWSPAAAMSRIRADHTATFVAGRVLVVGGPGFDATTELYDPATGLWSPSATLFTARAEHTATLMPRGSVLVAGGCNPGQACPLASSELRLSADLSVAMVSSPSPVLSGQELTYTITVRNDGPDKAQRVLLRDQLPAGVDFVSASPGCSQEPPGLVSCLLGDLKSGAPAVERQIKVRPGQATPLLLNTATVQSLSDDPNSDDNRAAVTTEVQSPAPTPPPGGVTTSGAGGGSTPAGGAGGSVPGTGASPSAGDYSLPGQAGGAGADRARALRRCLAAARRHTRREQSRARGGSRAQRTHARRHGSRLRQRCIARFGRRPGRIIGLGVRSRTKTEIVLSFRAAGLNRGRPPVATGYLVKQSTAPIRDRRGFRRARSLCNGMCRLTPSRVRAILTLKITDLRPNTTYHYAIAARANTSRRLGPRSKVIRVRTR